MAISSGADFDCCIRSQKNLYPLTFTNANGTKTECEDYARLTGKYLHGQLPEIEARFVEIPCQKCSSTDDYDEPKVISPRMFILLPDRVNGFDELEKNIERLSMNKLSTGDLHKVNITVPVEYEETFDGIIDTLTRMGLTQMFSENAEISLTTSQIKIQEFNHYSRFNITKHVDSITDPGLINEKIPEVTVDRPFIAIITTTDENPLILHIGRYTFLQN